MIEAQAYLDNNYSLTERSKIKELNIREKNLTGSLDASDFINLERLLCPYNKLTNLILPQNSKLTKIKCLGNNLTILTINKQEYLKELHCSGNSDLTTLTVTNNPGLTELYCYSCQLTTLTVTNNPQLAILLCYINQLTNLNFLTTTNNENSLTKLNIRNNKLTGELATLAPNLNKFTKLATLDLSYNKLTGSLQSLRGLSNLQVLHIDYTKITSGLEYLPANLEYFYCEGTKLATELKDYKDKEWGHYNYQDWRKGNPKLINKVNKEKEELKQLISESGLTDYIHKNNLNLLTELPKYKRIYEINASITTLFQRWIKANEHILYQQQLESLQEQLARLKVEKEKLLKRNSDLETLTAESARLIAEQQAKLVSDYLLFTEQEEKTLQELIKAHKSYFQARKEKGLDVIKLRNEYFKLSSKLENESFMRAVENILTNLEELYQYEWIFKSYSLEKEQIPTKLENIEKHILTISKDIKTIKDNPQQVTNNLTIENTYSGTFTSQGNILIGNQLGDNTNLSTTNNYTTKLEEIIEEELLIANIELPRK